MYQVHEVNQIEQLETYRMVWNSLFQETREGTFFHSYEWFFNYWNHFGEGKQMRVLVVSCEEKVIGILPLVVVTESTRAGRVRTLTYPLSDWGTFYGPIGSNPTATLQIGMKHIAETPRDWDLLDLRWVDQDGTDRGRTEQAMTAAHFAPHAQPWNQTAVVELNGDWDTYWKNRTKKWRANVRRSRRRLEELGTVRFVRYRPKGAIEGDGDPRWDLFDDMITVAKMSWQSDSTTGTTICDEEVYHFLRDTHAAAARTGKLDLNILYLNDRPVAFTYNYAHDGQVYGLRTGFDPELAEVSPGKVLLSFLIQDSFDRGDKVFDMGVGLFKYKREWATAYPVSYRYTFFPWTDFKSQLLRAKRWYQVKRLGHGYLPGAKQWGIGLG